MRNSSREMCAYLSEQIERWRRKPGEDLISALVQAQYDGGALAAARTRHHGRGTSSEMWGFRAT
jgi:cytochrome P450